MLRALLTAMLFVLWSGPAFAKKKDSEGVPVKVTVLDSDNNPVTTAVIRHPKEADRHRVNSITGSWEASVLYLPDGSELVFTPGMSIQLEVSAPGYMTKVIQYDIRKRKNNIDVQLDPLVIDDDNVQAPIIQFGRDKPRDDAGTGPAN